MYTYIGRYIITYTDTCMYCVYLVLAEDARCEISKLFEALKEREYLTSTVFIKVHTYVCMYMSLLTCMLTCTCTFVEHFLMQ